jgi:hypothetical protein
MTLDRPRSGRNQWRKLRPAADIGLCTAVARYEAARVALVATNDREVRRTLSQE